MGSIGTPKSVATPRSIDTVRSVQTQGVKSIIKVSFGRPGVAGRAPDEGEKIAPTNPDGEI